MKAEVSFGERGNVSWVFQHQLLPGSSTLLIGYTEWVNLSATQIYKPTIWNKSVYIMYICTRILSICLSICLWSIYHLSMYLSSTYLSLTYIFITYIHLSPVFHVAIYYLTFIIYHYLHLFIYIPSVYPQLLAVSCLLKCPDWDHSLNRKHFNIWSRWQSYGVRGMPLSYLPISFYSTGRCSSLLDISFLPLQALLLSSSRASLLSAPPLHLRRFKCLSSQHCPLGLVGLFPFSFAVW